MKKVTALLLSLMLMFTLTGCQSESETETSTNETKETETADTGNTLIVYYSATGNTENVANMISEETGGDLFELEPVEPYSDDDLDYRDENSRVSKEYEDESLRNVELVSTIVENFDSYDTVFIGYPIWWGNAAWPVNTFVVSNDFTGKRVIPFCTSASSGKGRSDELLAEMAETGNWEEGIRFSSNASLEDVKEWLESLD